FRVRRVMSRYRCCCCPVSVGSRIFAVLTALGSFLSLIDDFWSPNTWYYWTFNGILLLINIIAAVLVFVAVRNRNAFLMIPILVITVLLQILGLIYLGFAIAAICTPDSPLGQYFLKLFNDQPWFSDIINTLNITIFDYIKYVSITLSVFIFISLLFNVWIFVTHFQTYKSIRDRERFCHHAGPLDEMPSSYPSVYPHIGAGLVLETGFASAPPIENPSYPTHSSYAINPESGQVEHMDHAWK
ncbi:hypothetical protein PMAYCL1PPCAC_19132, partial [Pristionchus mayeri]